MHRRYDKNLVPIELLQTLVVISKAGSFTRAGAMLDLSQSAISAQVRRLEQLVGGNIFERAGGGLTLSPRGKTVERYAHRILELNDQLLSLSGAQSSKALVRIGVMTSFAAILMVKIFKACLDAKTGTQVQLQCDASPSLIQAMDEGHLDIAVVLGMDATTGDVIAEWDEQLVWLCAPDLMVSPNAPIPYISWPNSQSDRIAINALELSGKQFFVAFAGNDFNSRYVAAQAGLGYLLMPERAVFEGVKIAQESFLPRLPSLRAGIRVRSGFDKRRHRPLLNAIISIFASLVPLRVVDEMLKSDTLQKPLDGAVAGAV
jgi:DNA-binding transcriptional LysR family regulator